MHIYESVVFAIEFASVVTGCIGTTTNAQMSAPAGNHARNDSAISAASSAPVATTASDSPCGLPNVGASGVARPSGKAENLKVLDWAGFEAAVSWSYDDAQPSHIEHYAELQATGIRQTFYLSTGDGNKDNLGALWAQAVRDGHELGNHTAHHCHANGLGCSFGAWAGSIGAELDQCTAFITQNYPQKSVWTAASPFGDVGYDAQTQSRFLLNRGVKGGMVGPNDSTDPSELPCHMAASGESSDSFNKVIMESKLAGKWVIMVIHSVNPTQATWYNPVELAAITSSIATTKEFGTVWQDSVVNVGAYWMGQKAFMAGTTKSDGASLTRTWRLPKTFPSGKCLRVTADGGVVTQNGKEIAWNDHGYYEIALDVGALTFSAR